VSERAMTKIVLTYEDFVELPDDGNRYELHEGELSVTPSPGARHQLILGNLYLILAPHVRASGRGEIFLSPFDCIMTNITVVEPDLIYLDESRRALLSERAIEGSPTLAIEVLSPYSIRIDRRRKFELYTAHDVTWYWIVDPVARAIEAYHLEEGAYRLVGTLEGNAARSLPPFDDLPLDPAAVWR
jgi:Uma2 family endonuclease